jgi:16S rRNA (adenine1518-N6/adenine1519-N6)-dimethyltransferase
VQTLSDIRALLDAHGLKPQHRLGQNFLHDKNLLTRLVQSAGITPGELVLEIGPGTGTLTEGLCAAGAQVVACEIDGGLAGIMRDRFPDVQLLECDCLGRGRRLAAPLTDVLEGRPFKLVANLPFQVASTVVVTLLVHHPECHGLFVTIQQEVAERLAAEPGTKAFGALTVTVRGLAEVTPIAQLPASCFWPRPKVASTMVAIRPCDPQEHGITDPVALATFATTLFGKRRKQLGTIFGRDIKWPDGITPDLRPDALTVHQIIKLCSLFCSSSPP